MDQKFFIQPFAFAGDKTPIPDPVQPSGDVSFNQGYGFDYQRELGVDPDAKSIERAPMNWLFGAITENIGQYQRESIPEFISSADNGGVPFPYARGVMVRYKAAPADPFVTYVSKVAANVDLPSVAASWEPLVFERASNAQALAGTDNTTIMTPLRVAEAITASSASVPPASETVAGIAEIATTAEVTAGTDDQRIVTPLKLAQYVPAASTTVAGKSRFATAVETSALSLTTVGVTPGGMAALMGTKADLASPTFSGTPAAPTAAAGTNTTQLATTAFVTAGLALKANLASPTFTGVPSGPTAAAGTNTTQLATTAFVRANDDPAKANLAGAAFTGSISVTGNVTASGVFQKTSSRLVKRDLRPLPYGLAHIEQIETAIGRYIEDIDPTGREQLFLIAENLLEVIPTVVDREASEYGGAKIPAVDYEQLVPVLVVAIQELSARLRRLEG